MENDSSMPVTPAEIDAFRQFAKEQIGDGETGVSMQEILDRWQARREAKERAGDIRQRITDIGPGKGKPGA